MQNVESVYQSIVYESPSQSKILSQIVPITKHGVWTNFCQNYQFGQFRSCQNLKREHWITPSQVDSTPPATFNQWQRAIIKNIFEHGKVQNTRFINEATKQSLCINRTLPKILPLLVWDTGVVTEINAATSKTSKTKYELAHRYISKRKSGT